MQSAIFITLYQGHILSTRFMTVDVYFDHLGEVVLAGFSTIKLPFTPLSILWYLEGSHYAQPRLKKWEVMSGEYHHKLFVILYGRFVYSPPLIYSVIISAWTHEYLYFGL